MLKIKLQIKAQQNSSYEVFYQELGKVIEEQSRFMGNLEYQVAVAEAMDPVSVDVFAFGGKWHRFDFHSTAIGK